MHANDVIIDIAYVLEAVLLRRRMSTSTVTSSSVRTVEMIVTGIPPLRIHEDQS